MLGAILSQAFDRSLPIVEANSQRVLCRLFGQRGEVGRGPVRRWLWDTASVILPRRRVGDFNQAVMELGALICTPSRPRCGECPLARQCVAAREGLQESIPVKSAQPTPVPVREAALVIRRRGRVLLTQRPPRGRWSMMWEFPHGELAVGESIEDAAHRLAVALTGLQVTLGPELMTIRHGVTHHRITMTSLDAEYVAGEFHSAFYRAARWVRPAELGDFPVSSPQRRLARALG